MRDLFHSETIAFAGPTIHRSGILRYLRRRRLKTTASRKKMSTYFALNPFLTLSCLGFLMFLSPLSLRPTVSSFRFRQDSSTSWSRSRRAARSHSLIDRCDSPMDLIPGTQTRHPNSRRAQEAARTENAKVLISQLRKPIADNIGRRVSTCDYLAPSCC